MRLRKFLLLCSAFFLALPALADLSGADAAVGLKEALRMGAGAAIEQLGKGNGFLDDKRVRIPLPDKLSGVEKLMRTLGAGKYADKLIATMNHAAEKAVVEARPILLKSVEQMSFSDAIGILRGADDAATSYFRRTTGEEISARFLPIVKEATAKAGLAKAYGDYAGKAAKLGLLSEKDADLDQYVTAKAVDGLFFMIAEEEKAIRKDPIATGSAILKRIFGFGG